MIKAINPDSTFEHICHGDTENPTIWMLGVLDARIRAFINDKAMVFEADGKAPTEAADQAIRAGTWQWLTVKYGLRGWRNWCDANGQPIAESFDRIPHGGKSYTAVSDRLLEILPADVIVDLSTAISRANTLQEGDKRPFG